MNLKTKLGFDQNDQHKKETSLIQQIIQRGKN